MVSRTATVLAFSSLVIAHPQFGSKHHHHFHGTGTGSWGGSMPMPTGAGSPFPMNGTMPGSNDTAPASSSSLPVVSVTVQPLPSSAAAPGAGFSSPAGVGQNQGPSSDTNVAPVMSTTCTDSTTIVTETSTQFVTVTAGAAGAAGEGASPSAAPSVSAGAFYGYPSHSWGGQGAPSSAPGFGGQSSAPAVGGQSSAPAFGSPSGGAAPTTFATMPSAAASSAGGSPAWPSSSGTPTTGGNSTGGGSAGGKGVAYNSASVLSDFPGLSWAYNWAASPDGSMPSGMEYVPMCWGLSSTGAFAAAASSAISSGSSHLLSFNEPDLSTQSNIDPATAAKNHIQYLNPFSGQAQIGSPAITNGAGTSPLMGIDWLNAFFQSCAGQCKVDFVAFHWYADASNLAYFKQHVQDVINAAASNGVSKVWLTEFGASGDDSDVATFLTDAMSFLDSTPAVERYAYFMASDGILLSGNGLSSLGQTYTS